MMDSEHDLNVTSANLSLVVFSSLSLEVNFAVGCHQVTSHRNCKKLIPLNKSLSLDSLLFTSFTSFSALLHFSSCKEVKEDEGGGDLVAPNP